MALAAASALVLLLAAPGEPRLDVGVRAEERTRSFEQGGERATLSALEALPMVRVAVDGAEGTAAIAYVPRLRIPDLGAGADLAFLHVAEARIASRPGALVLRATASAARGEVDLLTERRDTPELQALRTTTLVRTTTARADAALEARPDRRAHVTAAMGWELSNGDDSASRQLLPLARTARASAALAWDASRRDVLSARSGAQATDFPGTRLLAVADLEGGWRRRISRDLSAWISGGASWSLEDPRGGRASRALLPAGEAGAALVPARGVTASTAARLRTAIDRATERVMPRLELDASLAWPVGRGWTAGARALGAATRGEDGRLRIGRAELRTDRPLGRRTTVGGGVYGEWQRSRDPALPSFSEAGLFVALGWDPPR